MSVVEDVHMDTRLQPAVNLVLNALHEKYGSNAVTFDAVNEVLATLLPAISAMFEDVVAEDAEAIRKQVNAKVVIVAPQPPDDLTADDFEPWLADALAGGAVHLRRWYNYKKFLVQEGFAPQVLESMDQSTNEIVDLIGDPRIAGSWKRRGLVIGDVQSGKTATYIGVLNKAADVGYKLIILLAGGTESLRKQTQVRVDEGFVGKDSAMTKQAMSIGVGNFKIQELPVLAQTLTSYASDFNTSSAEGGNQLIDPNDPVPMVFVIKKNKTALEKVIGWLKGQEHHDVPMLVVDDESDYASINTKYHKGGDSDPTLINMRIRELLATVPRASYMAFTATPFANVFIDHETFDEALADDLFPHDYICALSSPSNYLGAAQHFGTSDDPEYGRLVFIEDADDTLPLTHKSSLVVEDLPDSLHEAIRTYVLASAIRELRGDSSSRSMLVNVSRFKAVQAQVHELVLAEFGVIKSAVELHSSTDVPDVETNRQLAELRRVFERHYGDGDLKWDFVRPRLLAGVIDTSVQLINSDNRFDSEAATKHVIAVGGNVLSRGLTLDGLTVSYFHRVTGAADTLMQMARWFGYRPGYADLVKVWIRADVADHFRYVAEVLQELRAQLREMKSADKTPSDFGLAVRKHPESLRITAANKQGAGTTEKFEISLSGRRIETTKLSANPSILNRNLAVVRSFIQSLEDVNPQEGWQVEGMPKFPGKRGVPRQLIADLLEGFVFEETDAVLRGPFLSKAIRTSTKPKFNDWTVGFVTGDGDGIADLAAGLKLESTPERSVRILEGDNPKFAISGRSARLAGKFDLADTFDIGGSKLPEVNVSDGSAGSVYVDLPHPTLLVYFLTPRTVVTPGKATSAETAQQLTEKATGAWKAAEAAGVTHLVGIKIAVQGAPGSDGADVEYIVTSTWRREIAGEPTLSREDAEDLDD